MLLLLSRIYFGEVQLSGLGEGTCTSALCHENQTLKLCDRCISIYRFNSFCLYCVVIIF